MTAERRFTVALRSVMAALDELAAPSMIIGGVAVIAAGVPRQTIDIDATILGRAASLEDVIGAFERHDIVPRDAKDVVAGLEARRQAGETPAVLSIQ